MFGSNAFGQPYFGQGYVVGIAEPATGNGDTTLPTPELDGSGQVFAAAKPHSGPGRRSSGHWPFPPKAMGSGDVTLPMGSIANPHGTVVLPLITADGRGFITLPAYGEGEATLALVVVLGAGTATEPAWLRLEEDWLLGLIDDEELMAA